MKSLFKFTAIAAALAAASVAHADPAETKGGIKVKTDDGRFEATVGGRIHFDAFVFDNDKDAAFGSNATPEQGGFTFRRTYLTLTGKLYGWKYKFENDFTAATPASYREMWISTTLGGGELTIGQFKPYRGMEELTSSNDITMIERPWTSATGIYNSRQFLTGLGYKGLALGETLGYAVHAMGLSANTATTEGSSVGGRLFYVPFADEGNALHLGLSYSIDDEDTGSLPAAATHNVVAPYAGRRGPSINLGNAGAAATAASTDNAQSTFAIEAAYAFGPVTLQTEYAMAKLDNTHVVNGTPTDSDATSFYLQGSWFVTGEKTQYRKDRGAFQKPKSYNSANGAWEVVARYEMAENKDQSLTENTTGTAGSKAEASVFVLGANWYLNPSMRFMLNYYTGEADRGVASAAPGSPERKDKPKAITLRTQLSF